MLTEICICSGLACPQTLYFLFKVELNEKKNKTTAVYGLFRLAGILALFASGWPHNLAHFTVSLCKRICSLYLTYQCGVHKHLIIMDIITLHQKKLFGRACVVSALLAIMATVGQWWCYGIKIVLDTNIVHSPSRSSGMNNSTDINKLRCLVMSSSQNDRHLNNIHNSFNYSSSKTRTVLWLCCCCFFHLWSFYSQP